MRILCILCLGLGLSVYCMAADCKITMLEIELEESMESDWILEETIREGHILHHTSGVNFECGASKAITACVTGSCIPLGSCTVLNVDEDDGTKSLSCYNKEQQGAAGSSSSGSD